MCAARCQSSTPAQSRRSHTHLCEKLFFFPSTFNHKLPYVSFQWIPCSLTPGDAAFWKSTCFSLPNSSDFQPAEKTPSAWFRSDPTSTPPVVFRNNHSDKKKLSFSCFIFRAALTMGNFSFRGPRQWQRLAGGTQHTNLGQFHLTSPVPAATYISSALHLLVTGD